MSTPVSGSLATVPLFVAAGDIAVWWNDAGATWESVPLGSGPAGPQGVPGPPGDTGATGAAGSANMSSMVAGEIPIAASATSVTSSIPTTTFVARAGDTMTGALHVNNAIYSAGAGSGLFFEDRANSAVDWGWYATGGTAALYNTTSSNVVSVTTAGNMGVGYGAPQGRLHVAGPATAGAAVAVIGGGPTTSDTTTALCYFTDAAFSVAVGSINRNGTNSVAYLTTSDLRLKQDVAQSETGLAALMRLNVAEYRFAGDDNPQQGFVAQELHEIYPIAVHVGGENPKLDPWMIDYGRLTPLLVRAIQQQQERINVLEQRLEALEADR